jgi:hypothetical protein
MHTTRLTQPATGAPRRWAVMGEMKVSQEDVGTRAWAWRGVGAGMASRFMANRALSSGARTNGAVCAAPGGSRHRLYHRAFEAPERKAPAGLFAGEWAVRAAPELLLRF